MVKFTDFTKKYLKTFYNKRGDEVLPGLKELRKKVYKNYNKNLKYDIEEYHIPIEKIKKLIDTEWVDQEVINNLGDLKVNYKISWTYKDINHKIYYKSSRHIEDRLVYLLNVLNSIYDKKEIKENRPITMYLILTHLKKQPPSSSIVGVKNVNSGYTDFSTNEILVWREEEFEKVIFHEMIHYMDLDVRNMAFDDKELPHHIDGPKSYFEAFTDIWGNIFYFIYLSIITGKSANSLFQIEYQFMKNQANLFNKIFNLKDWKNKKTIKQNTPAFTYYILKFLIYKEIIKSGTLDILNNPRDLLIKILSSDFKEEQFVNLNSTRMTLIQLE